MMKPTALTKAELQQQLALAERKIKKLEGTVAKLKDELRTTKKERDNVNGKLMAVQDEREALLAELETADTGLHAIRDTTKEEHIREVAAAHMRKAQAGSPPVIDPQARQ
jgi:chromosome segregation ATPase